MEKYEVLKISELKEKYNYLFKDRPLIKLNKNDVPKALWPLIPYAETWGIADDFIRGKVIKQTPKNILDNFKYIITQFEDELDDWLAGPEADKENPTLAYIAFSAMRMAYDLLL